MGGIDITDRVFSDAMFGSDSDLFDTWVDLPKHPLQTQEPKETATGSPNSQFFKNSPSLKR